MSVQQGSSSSRTLTLTSVNGLAGSLAVTASTSSNATGWMTVIPNPVVVNIDAGKTVSSAITIAVRFGTPTGSYLVTVQVTSSVVSHSTSFTVTVSPAPDFTITASPASLTVHQSNYNTTTIFLTSASGFAGSVSFSASTPFAFLSIAGGQSPLKLVAGGSNSTLMAISATNLTPLGTYSVNVTGTSGGLFHTITITVLVLGSGGTCGCCACGTEALSLESYVFNSGTNVTLYLRNTGTSNITLATYYVRDTSGDQYSNTAWSGPTIPTSNVGPAVILIGSSCSSCTLSGSPFTFTAGNAYSIVFVTSRNNQFTYTIVR